MEDKKKIISIDAETDGLWGKPFMVSLVVDEGGVTTTHESVTSMSR